MQTSGKDQKKCQKTVTRICAKRVGKPCDPAKWMILTETEGGKTPRQTDLIRRDNRGKFCIAQLQHMSTTIRYQGERERLTVTVQQSKILKCSVNRHFCAPQCSEYGLCQICESIQKSERMFVLTLCSGILYSIYTLCAFDLAHRRDYSLLIWEPDDTTSR